MFQDKARWVQGAPLTYQKFINHNFGKGHVTTYSCETDYKIIGVNDEGILELTTCPELSDQKKRAQHVLHPYNVNHTQCTLLLLVNLAEPEWISVDCSTKLLYDILCVVRKKNRADNGLMNLKGVRQKTVCPWQYLLNRGKCYIFFWYNVSFGMDYTSEKLCQSHSGYQMYLKDHNNFDFLLETVSSSFPPILLMHDVKSSLVYKLTYRTHLKKNIFKQSVISVSEAEGFFTCQASKSKLQMGTNLFHCHSGAYISSVHLCDGIIDCPNDKSDEQFCICSNKFLKSSKGFLCKQTMGKSNESSCSPLYFVTHVKSCYKYLDISLIENTNNMSRNSTDRVLYECYNGIKLDYFLVNDLYADCGPEGEDEPLLLSMLTNYTFTTCDFKHQIPCKLGHSKCYEVKDICNYQLDMFKHLAPCRNGAHLDSCKHFDCNATFKCQGSYCIPWSYVCDGIWDCPSGEDEVYDSICGTSIICANMYKCRKTTRKCFHLSNVCDGKKDCVWGDDEYLCSLSGTMCPKTCSCLALAMKCSFSSVIQFESIFPHLLLYIHNCVLPDLKILLSKFPQILYLRLTGNGITSICNTLFGSHLTFLDLGFNLISALKKYCLTSLNPVKVLLLDYNHITNIESETFTNLSNLKVLSLSNNPLLNFPKHLIKGLTKAFSVLAIRNLSLVNIDRNAFDDLSVKVIKATDYQICCISHTKSECTDDKPWYISCSDLLPTKTMKVFFIFVSILLFVANGISILIHILTRKSNKAFSASVVAINTCDIICGIYLSILWVADLIHKGSFLVKRENWRSSGICFTAYGFVLWFTLLTQLLLFFLSLSRLMVVIYPVDTRFKRTKFTIKTLFLMYISSFLMSAGITLIMKFSYAQLPLSLCSPFIDPTNSIIMTDIVTWIVVMGQIITSFAILVAHVVLVYKMRESAKRVQKSKTGDDSDIPLVIQLVIITTSNILCWFPANGIYILAMFLTRYPTDLVIWTTVGSLPINSLINPTVFAITALRKACKSKKKLKATNVVAKPVNCNV